MMVPGMEPVRSVMHLPQKNSDCVIKGNRNIRERIVVPLIDPDRKDDAMLQSGCNKLYRIALIREKGVSFSTLRWAEDWLFNIEYLMHTQCVAFLPSGSIFMISQPSVPCRKPGTLPGLPTH